MRSRPDIVSSQVNSDGKGKKKDKTPHTHACQRCNNAAPTSSSSSSSSYDSKDSDDEDEESPYRYMHQLTPEPRAVAGHV
ncbi:hypothetical protein RRG08_049590 [Elysia crispata]|uniref:Uncharacterized protein n=1 Tax=Elysia crispata TaxID=231223 RepID=A0AAE1E5E5_9GAST|nr:hypothetical protein RRG08_049590 [Elysia crispata]